MRVVVQRVSSARVKVDHQVIGEIKKGFLLYIGVHEADTIDHAIKLATKIHNLRIFEDEMGKMNLNLKQVSGEILAISQFTLYGDTKGNNRPSFILAARPDHANMLYDKVCELLAVDHQVEKGSFGAHMEIESVNDGPVTIIIEI
jgi:D-tyrosyl-tRNA(Tyr) deacylase